MLRFMNEVFEVNWNHYICIFSSTCCNILLNVATLFEIVFKIQIPSWNRQKDTYHLLKQIPKTFYFTSYFLYIQFCKLCKRVIFVIYIAQKLHPERSIRTMVSTWMVHFYVDFRQIFKASFRATCQKICFECFERGLIQPCLRVLHPVC